MASDFPAWDLGIKRYESFIWSFLFDDFVFFLCNVCVGYSDWLCTGLWVFSHLLESYQAYFADDFWHGFFGLFWFLVWILLFCKQQLVNGETVANAEGY